MPTDDQRLAAASRALRRQKRLTQSALVGATRSRHIPRLIEDGRVGELRVNDVRDFFAKLGATVRLSAWYEGAVLDRLIDRLHADVVESAVRELRRLSWPIVDTEVSFNEWGDRGSIDFMAANQQMSAVVIGEAKSAWGSLEETLRSLDVKSRLAAVICEKRYGWRPASIGVVLALPEEATARRIAMRYGATLLAGYSSRNREIGRWLRQPRGALRGLWFLSNGGSGVPPDS